MWTLLVVCALILFVFFWNHGSGEAGLSEQAPGSKPEPGAAWQKPVKGSTDETKGRMFSARFVPLFLISFTSVFLGCFTVIKIEEGANFDWREYAILTALITIPGSVVAAMVIRRLGQLTLNDSAVVTGGISVDWKDMEVTETRFVLIWRALKIRSRVSGKRFWLLRTIYRRREFRNCVMALAPPGCPLFEYLSKEDGDLK
jgi:hypothetical protein